MTKYIVIFILMIIYIPILTFAQSEKLIDQWKREYLKQKKPEISLKQWLEYKKEIERLRKQNKSKRIACNPIYDSTGCTNGDFNSGVINSNVWQGEYGNVVCGNNLTPNVGVLDETTLNCGILSGAINNYDVHLTIVQDGTDPIVPNLKTTPDNQGYSLRIGNGVGGCGAEMANKSFKVTSDNAFLTFDYAVVLEEPGNGHSPNTLPTFRVIIKNENTGEIVNGLIDLDGSGNDYVRTDNTQFFNTTSTSYNLSTILYSDWLCAQINLTSLIGKNVTVSFITEDCGHSGHFAYAYIDNVCSGCSNAPYSLSFDKGKSSDCGLPANICFDYTIPNGQNLNIQLKAQSGSSILQTWNSPSLTSGSNYCFTVNSINNIGSNQTINFSATGNFSNAPNQNSGISGYKISCGGSSDNCNCCPRKSIVKNGSFEGGEIGFSTSFQYYNPNQKSNVYPGIYSILNSTQALAESPDWKLRDSDCCSKTFDLKCCDKGEKFLIINGRNNQPLGTHSIIYQTSNSNGPVGTPILTQSIKNQLNKSGKNRFGVGGVPIREVENPRPVRDGKKKNYKFCIQMKHLAQSTFDVIPEGQIVITDSQGNSNNINYKLTRKNDACHWDSFEKFIEGVAPFTISISLREDRPGDGNDLAIDNVSIIEIPQVKKDLTLFNVATKFINSTQYNVIVTKFEKIPAGCFPLWTVCEYTNGSCKSNTDVNNPTRWWKDSHNFNGYNGTSSLGSANQKGVFEINKTYMIKHSVFCECASLNETVYIMSFDAKSKSVLVKDSKGAVKYRGEMETTINKKQ